MLLCGSSQVRPTSELGAPTPQQIPTVFNLRGEQLVFEVTRFETNLVHQAADGLRLRNVPGQRLLAREAQQLPLPSLDDVDDLANVLDPRLVGSAQPDRVDLRIRDHVSDGRVGLRRTHIQTSCEFRSGARVLGVRAPDTEDIRVADRLKGLDMKTGVESTTNESNAQTSVRHAPSFLLSSFCAGSAGSSDPGR